MHDEELTPAEREAFAQLPRTAPPGDLLEERAVRALAMHGLLQAPGPRRQSRAWAWAGAAAACVVFFVAGFTFGQRHDAAPSGMTAIGPAGTAPGVKPQATWQTITADSIRSGDTRYVVWF